MRTSHTIRTHADRCCCNHAVPLTRPFRPWRTAMAERSTRSGQHLRWLLAAVARLSAPRGAVGAIILRRGPQDGVISAASGAGTVAGHLCTARCNVASAIGRHIEQASTYSCRQGRSTGGTSLLLMKVGRTGRDQPTTAAAQQYHSYLTRDQPTTAAAQQ